MHIVHINSRIRFLSCMHIFHLFTLFMWHMHLLPDGAEFGGSMFKTGPSKVLIKTWGALGPSAPRNPVGQRSAVLYRGCSRGYGPLAELLEVLKPLEGRSFYVLSAFNPSFPRLTRTRLVPVTRRRIAEPSPQGPAGSRRVRKP